MFMKLLSAELVHLKVRRYTRDFLMLPTWVSSEGRIVMRTACVFLIVFLYRKQAIESELTEFGSVECATDINSHDTTDWVSRAWCSR